MRRKGALVRGVVALIAGGWLLGTVGPAGAAEFYAVLWNVTGARNPQAHIEVGTDSGVLPAGTNVSFVVFDIDGLLLSEFTLPLSATGFVSSAFAAPPNDNLFAVSAGRPALVRVRTPAAGGITTAVLHQTLRNSRMMLGVPWNRDAADNRIAMGQTFPVTLGEFSRATLLVANVSGLDVTVDVFAGTKGADGSGRYSIRLKPLTVGRLDIDPADANSHLFLSSTNDIIAHLVVSTGTNTVSGVTLIPFNNE